MNTAQLSSPVRSYVQARENLHKEIQSRQLLGDAAWSDDDQVTLRKDVTAGSVTFKAGSSYHLDPYADRERHTENLTWSQGNSTVVIRHEIDPGTFLTSETLSLETSGSLVDGLSSFKLQEESGGWRPDGWVQKELDRAGADGFILKL